MVMKRYIKIFVLGSFFVIFALAIYILLCPARENSTPGTQEVETKKVTNYYVPVTNYFSTLDIVNLEKMKELKDSGNLVFEEEEKDNIASILGEGYSDTPTVKKDTIAVREGQVAIVRWNLVTPGLKTIKYDNQYFWDVKDMSTYALKKDISIGKDEAFTDYDPKKVTRIKAGGDVMLSRHVATKISSLGILSPWKYVGPYLADSDITFVNLEVPLSDRFPVPSTGMSFIAPTKYIEGLTTSGIDIVSVANNHSANFGQKVFEDDLATLKAGNISACGGGMDDIEARTVKVVERNGIKYGFLCYNAITGGLMADTDSGMASLSIEPWYRDDEASIQKLEDDIRKAKQVADVVVVSPHWGIEYKLVPSESQKKVARRAIDAGADLILGTHPHVVQGSEIYKGRYITYSLGNLIFDQEWSIETKQGIILDNYFYEKKQVSANIVPVQIENYHQPKFATGNLGKSIVERIRSASVGF
jgi:poly-gamma-glutamate capsule biosynthesis protein CapA/YwtB (metallophosphatase superfamily)